MSDDLADVSVMATLRCHKTFRVPAELLEPGNEAKLDKAIVAAIDEENDPFGWEPESFQVNTDIYLVDQERDIVETPS